MKHFYQKVDDPMVTAYGKYISTLGLTKSVLLTSVFLLQTSCLPALGPSPKKTSVSKTDFPSPGRIYIFPFISLLQK